MSRASNLPSAVGASLGISGLPSIIISITRTQISTIVSTACTIVVVAVVVVVVVVVVIIHRS